MIEHITQPKDSNLCGQACVAMAAGVSLEESIQVFDTSGKTRTVQVIDALKHLGVTTSSERLIKVSKDVPLPPYAILHVQNVFLEGDGPLKKAYHWVLLWDGVLHDPILKRPGRRSGGVVVSYLPFLPKKGES